MCCSLKIGFELDLAQECMPRSEARRSSQQLHRKYPKYLIIPIQLDKDSMFPELLFLYSLSTLAFSRPTSMISDILNGVLTIQLRRAT